MNSWYSIRAREAGAELSIYDEIGTYGVSAKAFIADIGALDNGAPLELRLNSPGGSVFDAVAIYNALQRHDGKITVTIDGIAASAASYIAMAGDEIVMPENAFLMIHDPSGLVMGTAGDMRDMAEALDKIAGSLIKGYAAKSGKPDDDIAALMAAETWFDATEAVEAGLADRVAEPVRIAARFDIATFRNAPPLLVEAAKDEPAEEATSEPEAEEGKSDTLVVDPPPCAVPDPVPDIDTIRAEAMAHAKAVVDLCRLAGQPQMAADFLEQNASLEAVRAALLEARAKSDPDISAAHPQPGPGSVAKPWGDVIARTFKRKGQ